MDIDGKSKLEKCPFCFILLSSNCPLMFFAMQCTLGIFKDWLGELLVSYPTRVNGVYIKKWRNHTVSKVLQQYFFFTVSSSFPFFAKKQFFFFFFNWSTMMPNCCLNNVCPITAGNVRLLFQLH